MANMDAVLVRHMKERLAGGYIVEIIVWRVPTPVPGSRHPFKYRMFFGRPSTRIIGYDNERGKGDHKHIDGKESAFVFTSIEAVEADFLAEVKRWREGR